MKTFDEVMQGELQNQYLVIKRMELKLRTGKLHNTEVIGAKEFLRKSEDNINNIDEVTRIKIGAVTNSLIRTFQRLYKFRPYDYNNQFEMFASQIDCYILGIEPEDLLLFKGRNPFSADVCNTFRDLVNFNFGTNIPFDGVEERAFNDYLDAEDEPTKDKALVRLRELQRDSGALYFGGNYHLLATDKEYQDAKVRCSRNIQM